MQNIMRVFSVVLLIMVGTVFAVGPAGLIVTLCKNSGMSGLLTTTLFWLIIILVYYFIATFISIDAIIGKIYPVFGICLIIMAVGVIFGIFTNPAYTIPEIWANFGNMHPSGTPIWSFMFITVACGAISGFHSTQTAIISRTVKSEKQGRMTFYNMMILEGFIAMIWAAAATYFFHNNGMEENNAAVVVDSITKEWLGAVGGVLAILGVIAAPITSGDTAFRSARLIVADFLHMEQKTVVKRLMICIPMFIVAIGILLYSQKDKDGFDMIWRYFAWSNQTLAVFTLWALTVYLVQAKKLYVITLIPALFMTAVCSTYIFVAPEGFGLSSGFSQLLGLLVTLNVFGIFLVWKRKKV